MRRNLPITTATVISSSPSTTPNKHVNYQQNLNKKKQRQQQPSNTLTDQAATTLLDECNNNNTGQYCCCSGNNNSTLTPMAALASEKAQVYPSLLPSSGFNLFEEEDRRRENAFKAVMIVCLCVSGCFFHK